MKRALRQHWKRAKGLLTKRLPFIYQGRTSHILMEAEIERNGTDYQEIRIGCYARQIDGTLKTVADIFVGVHHKPLNGNDEIRVLITADGEGDSDHKITVYPERTVNRAIELDNR